MKIDAYLPAQPLRHNIAFKRRNFCVIKDNQPKQDKTEFSNTEKKKNVVQLNKIQALIAAALLSGCVSCTDECDSTQSSILENIPEYMLKENENNRPNDTFLLENDDFSELDSIADEYILHKKELEKDLDSIPEITD